MSFYEEYLRQMGNERLILEQHNMKECYRIASNSRSSQDAERFIWKLQDIHNELKRRRIVE